MRNFIGPLSTAKKALLGVGACLLLIGAGGAAALVTQNQQPKKAPVQQTAKVKSAETKPAKPKTEVKIEEEKIVIPFEKVEQNDSSLPAGETAIAIKGENGEKVIIYEVTYTDGSETSREAVNEQISKDPIKEIVRVGTKAVVPPPAPEEPPVSIE